MTIGLFLNTTGLILRLVPIAFQRIPNCEEMGVTKNMRENLITVQGVGRLRIEPDSVMVTWKILDEHMAMKLV